MANRKTQPDHIDVQIFDATYTLRGGSDPSTVRALAAELDGRMRELAAPASTADPLKVAVLAALRLADEVRSAREESGRREAELAEKIETLVGRLDLALSASGPSDGSGGGAALDGGLALG